MKIEEQLILNKYLLDLFNAQSFNDLKNVLSNINEGINSATGNTYFADTLMNLGSLKINKEKIQEYDRNIIGYLKRINSNRQNKINLKYYQYLAILFTEIFLDEFNNNKYNFLNNINNFLEKLSQETIIKQITEYDLRKIAYWMATGSGKTIIFHINYLQVFKYIKFSPDAVILITPNEGLSKQHFEELQKSNIPAILYNGIESLRYINDISSPILIIEITKLTENKMGSGLSIPIESFEGQKIIFIDEGHKGKSKEAQKWSRIKNKLNENGFAFEYSATFGQVFKIKEVQEEYSKCIIFDYSYKYFYNDGYGKDYFIANLKNLSNPIPNHTFEEIMFTANLLDFYDQLKLFKAKQDLCKKYNIEKPLWIFVGTTVTGKNFQSDIIKIIEFISKAVEQTNWLENNLKQLLPPNNLFQQSKLFPDKFKNYMNLSNFNALANEIKNEVFNGQGTLEIYEIKNAKGELGLKVGQGNYFGVINIGDIREFKKLLAPQLLKEDRISTSPFNDIKNQDSDIKILIGSKKFIEGWDTWRVSSMGLLNIGKNEGPQIIQLFGRGVRLKGENLSLKRSNNPDISPLETINIYGINANYLNTFLNVLKEEEMNYETIEVPVQIMPKEEWEALPYLSNDKTKIFEDEEVLILNYDNKIKNTINLSPKISINQSKNDSEIKPTDSNEYRFLEILKSKKLKIEDLNWEKIFIELLEYKNLKRFWNVYFTKEHLKNILKKSYVIISFIDISSIEQIENIAILLLKNYIDKYYYKHKRKFDSEYVVCEKLSTRYQFLLKNDPSYYKIKVEQGASQKIREIIEKLEHYNQPNKDLKGIMIDQSVFFPLLLADNNSNIINISPPGLVKSEADFLEELKKFLNPFPPCLCGYKVIILRNESKSGLGFQLDWSGFYPDFIMWLVPTQFYSSMSIKNNSTSNFIDDDTPPIYITFIDPKGLEHSHLLDDEKVTFIDKTLPKIEEQLQRNYPIKLNGFILSATPYDVLIKGHNNPPNQNEFENNNILFLNDEKCISKLFKKINHKFNCKKIMKHQLSKSITRSKLKT